MKLIVGLGNPGEAYQNTRHNVGFMVVDKILNNDQNYHFQLNKPLKSEIAEIEIGDEKVILIKPQTFMNNSGIAVKKSVLSYQLLVVSDLVVIHDDISIDLGQVKISYGAGAGKHNGIQSIIDQVKTKDFIRIRCGIGRGNGVLSDVVLSKFRPIEKEVVEKMIQKAADACVTIVEKGLERAMNEVN